jgi:hypothetical protein
MMRACTYHTTTRLALLSPSPATTHHMAFDRRKITTTATIDLDYWSSCPAPTLPSVVVASFARSFSQLHTTNHQFNVCAHPCHVR